MISDELRCLAVNAFVEDNLAVAIELLDSSPELIDSRNRRGDGWAHQFVNWGAFKVMSEFLRRGASLDGRCNYGQTALHVAITLNKRKAFDWLVENGANLNLRDKAGATPLAKAAVNGRLEMAKVLLDRGADANLRADYGAIGPQVTPRDVADHFGFSKLSNLLADAGVAPSTSADRLRIGESDPIVKHMSSVYGEVTDLLARDVVNDSVTISVYQIQGQLGVKCTTLFTSGMSAASMSVQPDSGAAERAELMIHLPADWPVNRQPANDPETDWPLRWLLKIAEYPHSEKTSLGGQYVIIANDDPPKPIAPNTDLSCLLVLGRENEDRFVKLDDRNRAQLHTVFPLHTSERDFEKEFGIVALLQRFAENDVGFVVDCERKSVVF